MVKLSIPFLFPFLFASGCSDKGSSPVAAASSTTTEGDLYMLGKNVTGFVFYKHSDDTIAKGSGSGHSQPKLRTRYNSIAGQQLDASGKVKLGSIFKDSSLIVKELHTETGLDLLVFLFKKRGDTNADANGWVWAETSPTGSIVYPASSKGAGCISCHSSGIDYTRMNDTHP